MSQKDAVEIKRSYAKAAREIRDILGRLDPETFTESKAAAASLDINRAVNELNAYAARWANRAVRESYEQRRKVERTRLEVLGRDRRSRFNLARHDEAAALVAKAALHDYRRANETIRKTAASYIAIVRKGAQGVAQLQAFAFTPQDTAVVRQMTEEAIDARATRKTLARRIMDFLREKIGGGYFIEINGRSYRLDLYAELVAGYRMREAASEATKNVCSEYDNDLVEITMTYDDRVCDDCKEIQGQVYSLTGKTPGYPVLTAEITPPIHPHCTHSIRATSEEAMEARAREAARGAE